MVIKYNAKNAIKAQTREPKLSKTAKEKQQKFEKMAFNL